MPLRYYPKFYVIENLDSVEGQFSDQSGKQYIGKYYATMNGRHFSGPNPEVGPNEEIFLLVTPQNFENAKSDKFMPDSFKRYQTSETEGITDNTYRGRPTFYYPRPTEDDYRRGYITRYFTKKENEKGMITEISYNEYVQIVNGTANYDISIYQTTKILWKLTGPLNNQRKSQYNVIPGIIDTNKRLTEASEKTFLGIVEFIGGQYDKFARPTP